MYVVETSSLTDWVVKSSLAKETKLDVMDKHQNVAICKPKQRHLRYRFNN